MKSTHFLAVSSVIVLWPGLVRGCPDGYYRDPVTRFCSRCADLCSRERDSWPECKRLCPGWGATTKSTTTSSSTSSTTPTSTLQADLDTADTADNGSENVVGRSRGIALKHTSAETKSSQDNGKVLVGQHVTIALIGTCLFVVLVLILAFVAYKTKFHQRLCVSRDNEASSTGDQTRRNCHRKDPVNDIEEANGFLQASNADHYNNQQAPGNNNINRTQAQIHMNIRDPTDTENSTDPRTAAGISTRFNGINNPTYIPSIPPEIHRGRGNGPFLQSSPNTNMEYTTDAESFARSDKGTFVTYVNDDGNDGNTKPKEHISTC